MYILYISLKTRTRKGSITCCNVGTTLKVLSTPRYPSTLICSSTAPPFLPFTYCLSYLLSVTLILPRAAGSSRPSGIFRYLQTKFVPYHHHFALWKLWKRKLHCRLPFFNNLIQLSKSDLFQESPVAFIFPVQNKGNGRTVLSQSLLVGFSL